MPGINRQQKTTPFERYGGHPIPALQAIEAAATGGSPALAPAIGGAFGVPFRGFGQTDSPASMYNLYRMRAYQNTPQAMANSATVTVTLDTIDFDDNKNFSTSTSTYTAPVLGSYYLFAGVTVRLNQSPQGVGVAIAKGGTPLYDFVGNSCTGITSSLYYCSASLSDLFRFNQNDQITVQATNLSGGGASVSIAYAWLAIQLLSQG